VRILQSWTSTHPTQADGVQQPFHPEASPPFGGYVHRHYAISVRDILELWCHMLHSKALCHILLSSYCSETFNPKEIGKCPVSCEWIPTAHLHKAAFLLCICQYMEALRAISISYFVNISLLKQEINPTFVWYWFVMWKSLVKQRVDSVGWRVTDSAKILTLKT
jgi:hypothetical protein